jgi:hypothetical protein
MHLTTFLTTSLLISQTTLTTASTFELHNPLHARHLTIEQKARRDARSLMNHELYHMRRHAEPQLQAPGPSSTPAPDAIKGDNAAFDRNVWNASVTAACMKAISAMDTKAVNPSGMAACYNIPFLDTKTGVFEADLRLYQLSQPSGIFTGVTVSDSIALSYLGAQISNQVVSPQKRSLIPTPTFISLSLSKRQQSGSDSSATSMMAAFDFVGQINPAVIKKSPLNATSFEAILAPQIILSSIEPKNGALVNATINSDTVSYVAGKFAGVPSTNSTANMAVASAIVKAATAFVLPGTTLGIFPIGLIVTSCWTVLFIGVVGWGTWGRVQFRGHYRRRLARAAGINQVKKGGW